MKLKNLSFFLFPLIILSAVFFASCDDSGVVPENPPSGPPDIQFKPGSVYYFRNDSISWQTNNYLATRWLTKDSIMTATTYQGKSSFSVRSVTYGDSIGPNPGPIIRQSTDYYSYTQSEGIFYQWGARNLIDPSQTAQWDKIADFTQPIGTEVTLYTITNLFGQSSVSANIHSKIASRTVTPLMSQVSCYKIELRAEIVVTGFPSPVGNVYMDYYIGYASSASNPSGRVGTKIYPVNITVIPNVLTIRADGADQRLISYTLAP